jgi:lactoylglutathione lyase
MKAPGISLALAWFACLLLAGLLRGQEAPRPKITGVAHIAFYAKDPGEAARYYREFLGFEQAYAQPARTFKINDRQFIELYPEREAGSDRLHHIAIETDNAEAMRRYLGSRGIGVPDRVAADAPGRRYFDFRDPEGHTVRVVEYPPDSRIVRDKGKHLSEARISRRMMHVGILVTKLEPELRFYTEVLGFREFWRGSSNGTVLSWINLRVPDGEDYIELMLYKEAPAPTARGSAHHLCLEAPSVAEAAAMLEKRPYRTLYKRTIEPRVGRNRRRQVNLFDPDGSRAELMEPRTIDGVPAESSTAPPP